MDKKEFIELCLQAYSLKIVNPEKYFADLYDKAFKGLEDRLNKVLKDLSMIKEELCNIEIGLKH